MVRGEKDLILDWVKRGEETTESKRDGALLQDGFELEKREGKESCKISSTWAETSATSLMIRYCSLTSSFSAFKMFCFSFCDVVVKWMSFRLLITGQTKEASWRCHLVVLGQQTVLRLWHVGEKMKKQYVTMSCLYETSSAGWTQDFWLNHCQDCFFSTGSYQCVSFGRAIVVFIFLA